MADELQGNVTLDGSAVSGATVYAIDTTNGNIEGSATTDANGDFAINAATGTYHVAVQYEDGSTQYNDYSKPFVTVTAPFIDNFDDQDLSEYSGDTGSFSTVTSPTHDGSTAALSSSAWASEIYSTSGLGAYPSKGDEWEFYHRTDAIDDTYSQGGMDFGYDGGSDGDYWFARISHQSSDQYIELENYVGGTETATTTYLTNFSLSANTWYRHHFTWDDGSTFGGADGEVTWTIEDADSSNTHTASATESSITGGGIGWWSDTNITLYYDEAKLL